MQRRYALNHTKFLADPERIALEHRLQKELHLDPRNCLALLLLLKTGARAGEILNLRKEDLVPEIKSVFIRGLKGSNDREIPIRPSIFRWLYNYAETVTTERLFNISYNTLRDAWVKYRPSPKPLHSLRHTFAICVYKKTKDVTLLKLALGHRNINNTMIYLDFIYQKEELRRLLL